MCPCYPNACMYDARSSLSPIEKGSSLALALALPAMLLLGLLSVQLSSGTSNHNHTRLVSFSFAHKVRQKAVEPPRERKFSTKAAARKSSVSAAKSSPAAVVQNTRSAPRKMPRMIAADRPASMSIDLTAAAPRQSGNATSASMQGTSGNTGEGDASAERSGKEAGNETARDRYGEAVYRRIRRYQTYDRVLQRQSASGTVVLAFSIDRRGRLRSQRIAVSSGDATLDKIALRQLAAAQPFPRPPKGRERAFQIPLTYRPRD